MILINVTKYKILARLEILGYFILLSLFGLGRRYCLALIQQSELIAFLLLFVQPILLVFQFWSAWKWKLALVVEGSRNFLPQTHLVHPCLASKDVRPLVTIAIGQLMKNGAFFLILYFISVALYSSKNRRKFRVSTTYLVQQLVPFPVLLPHWLLQPPYTELIGSGWIIHRAHLLVHWIPEIVNFGHPCPCMYFGRNLLLFWKVDSWESLKDLPFI